MHLKYFVLNPSGTDAYAKASCAAMFEFARAIENTDLDLAKELRYWARDELEKANKAEATAA